MSTNRIKNPIFFYVSASYLAQELLGKIICRQMGDGFIIRCRITETEAYSGNEPFCYGYGGKKAQNKDAIFYSTGKVCVYADMFMISCTNEDTPDNILIRGIDCYHKPTEVTEFLDIYSDMGGLDLCSSDVIWIEDDGVQAEYIAAKRVNISDTTPQNFRLNKIIY